MGGNRLLVTSVGIGGKTGYSKTRYSLDGQGEYESELSPVALAHILNIDEVLVPCTTKSLDAHDHHEKLETGFEDAGVEYEFLEIEKVSDRSDVDEILDKVVSNIRERGPAEVVLDITHAFRSLPMVFFASLVYVDALGATTLGGIYYGEYQGDESPVIDLTYLYTLLEWYHALRSYENTGSLVPVAELLDEKKQTLFRQGDHPHDLATVAQKLDAVSRYFDSGLPMEAGIAAQEALGALAGVDESDFIGPEGTFFGPLATGLEGYEIQQDVGEKTAVELTPDELERQAAVVEYYRQKGKYWLAIECAREAYLNRVLYAHEKREPGAWLDLKTRKDIQQKTFYTGKSTDNRADAGDNRSSSSPVVQLWSRLTDYRNLFAHAGFKPKALPDATKIDSVLEDVCMRICNDEFWEEVA